MAAAHSKDENSAWQNKLLPFMIIMLITLTLFFFIATLVQLYDLNDRVQNAPVLPKAQLEAPPATDQPLVNTQWQHLILLEANVLEQRYHQANVLLLSRIWTRYLGFITGMIMALVGAVFVLGKLQEPATKLDASVTLSEGSKFGTGLATQSPGLVLATLGTALMLTTILTHHEISVSDGPVYTSVQLSGGGQAAPSAPPRQLMPDSAPAGSPDADVTDILNAVRERHGNDKENNP
ncbi:hypothetical protein [Alteromonas sp. CYL-A6]|uniref:hypothetical protein n=1 Tax=Alteromonas nitratireducens TaxID=3390813 RepID=UPI0034B7745E